eukprot:CAMPEP_0203953628 /NCGR_PEP_ID=MMETSP0359-20131031/86943_1 /ASSEMBLY_ACC=CAM_ASM_000338 /TAXON_ID=268821 /ORGANISM="Scrippsiella Hangoei, Strain SHTV-5" /LENGTH=556 /DNA_ID=CAMNT_0050887007 /DNA_START=40 /DNA_END=1707 /DNA_ORIENTATION=+
MAGAAAAELAEASAGAPRNGLMAGMRREFLARPQLILLMHSVIAVCTLVELLEVPFAQSLATCDIALSAPLPGVAGNDTCAAGADGGCAGNATEPLEAAAGGKATQEGWGGLMDEKRGTPSGSFYCADKGKVLYAGTRLQVHAKTCTKTAALLGGVAGASLADVCGRRITLMIYLAVSALATVLFAFGAGDPSGGPTLYLVGNFLQGLTKLPFMMRIFDADCMQNSSEPRTAKMMIDYSRGIVNIIVQVTGLTLLRRWVVGSNNAWSTIWIALTSVLGALFLQLAWSFPGGAPAAGAGAEEGANGDVHGDGGAAGPKRRGLLATAKSEVAAFAALVRHRPEARAWIFCDCLRAVCQRSVKIERSIVMLLFNTSYETLTAYAAAVPLLAGICVPLAPMLCERMGDHRAYLGLFTGWLGLQILCTLLLPLGWWMVPLKIYAGCPFAGLMLINFDLLQRIFRKDQAKLQSLAQSGTQLLAVAADYMFLWSFDPDATTWIGQMRPLLLSSMFFVFWWCACMFHPAWKEPRGKAFAQLEDDRQQRRQRAVVVGEAEGGRLK